MKKLLIGLTAIVLLIAAGSVFYACKKDTLNNDKSSVVPQAMMMGTHSQPVQNIAIQTNIHIPTGTPPVCPVTGNAVVGSYNGLIYECNLMWTIAAGTYTGYEMAFEAALKPGIEGSAVALTNGMQNYNITINGQPISETSGYTETVDGVDIVITPAEMVALWDRVRGYVADNVTIIEIEPIVITSDFSSIDISRIGHEDGMLVFESFKHYAQTIDALLEICNQYSDNYITELEARLGCSIEETDEETIVMYMIKNNFFPFNPLMDFIQLIGFTNSAYPVLRTQEIEWMANETRFLNEQNPFDVVGAGYVQSALHNTAGNVKMQKSGGGGEEGEEGETGDEYPRYIWHWRHNFGTNPDKECSKREKEKEIDKSFSHKSKNRKLKGVLVTGGAHVRGKTVNYVKCMGIWWLWSNKVYVNFNGDKLTHCYDPSSTISASASNSSKTGLTEKYYWFHDAERHINPTWLIPDGIAHIKGNHYGDNYSTTIKTELISN